MPLGGIGPEGVDRHYRPRHSHFQPNHLPQKSQQTFISAAAETAQERAVILEIDLQQLGDTEDSLPETPQTSALEVARRLRMGMERIRIPSLRSG